MYAGSAPATSVDVQSGSSPDSARPLRISIETIWNDGSFLQCALPCANFRVERQGLVETAANAVRAEGPFKIVIDVALPQRLEYLAVPSVLECHLVEVGDGEVVLVIVAAGTEIPLAANGCLVERKVAFIEGEQWILVMEVPAASRDRFVEHDLVDGIANQSLQVVICPGVFIDANERRRQEHLVRKRLAIFGSKPHSIDHLVEIVPAVNLEIRFAGTGVDREFDRPQAGIEKPFPPSAIGQRTVGRDIEIFEAEFVTVAM